MCIHTLQQLITVFTKLDKQAFSNMPASYFRGHAQLLGQSKAYNKPEIKGTVYMDIYKPAILCSNTRQQSSSSSLGKKPSPNFRILGILSCLTRSVVISALVSQYGYTVTGV